MVPLTSLWLPVLLSAVLVFVASTIIHTVLGYHRADFRKLPDEEAFRAAVRPLKLAPGDYMVPCAESMKAMSDPAFIAKRVDGPVGVFTLMPAGKPNLAPALLQWFLYCILIAVFAGYVASRALGPGEPYLRVFQMAGTTAFVGFGLGLWHDSIWYKKSWAATMRSTFDGLIYGMLTAGCFGWLWPK